MQRTLHQQKTISQDKTIGKFNLLTLKELHGMPTSVSDTAQDIWTLLSRKASMDAENPWRRVPFIPP